MTFDGFGKGTLNVYVRDEQYSIKNQTRVLSEILNISQLEARKYFKNGVLGKEWSVKYIKENDFVPDEQQFPLIDSMYNRKLSWLPEMPSGFKFPRPVAMKDKERFVLNEIRMNLCGKNVEKEPVIDFEVPVWRPKNREDINEILQLITETSVKSRDGKHTIWLRGENKEYYVSPKRDRSILKWMGYPVDSGHKEPSLLPSMARKIRSRSFNKWQETTNLLSYWEKVLFTWVFLSNKEWFENAPDVIKMIEDAHRDQDNNLIGSLLVRISDDPKIYDEADDFRQWIMYTFKNTYLPLIMQHYGCPTPSMDVTCDVDVALFFALFEFDREIKRYIEKRHKRNLVYIFASADRYMCYEGTSIVSSEYIMKYGGPDRLPVDVPLRILRQKCGLLHGSDYFGVNRYADLILGKIILDKYDGETKYDQEYLFPGPNEDFLYSLLIECRPKLTDLIIYE